MFSKEQTKAIKIKMIEHNLTQRDLAEKVGVSASFLNLVMRGLKRPPVSWVEKDGVPGWLKEMIAMYHYSESRARAESMNQILADIDIESRGQP